MSDNKSSAKYHVGCRKKRNKKRQATSPLSDTGLSVVNTSEYDSNKREQRKGLSKKGRQEYSGSNTQSVSGFTYGYTHQNMAFQQQTPFGQMSQMSQPSYAQSSPPAPSQFNSNAFGFQPSPPPPPWANELLEEMKQIKVKLQSMDKIEKTVNSINMKVSDLETKLKSLDTRVTETEKSCQFSASESETNKKDLKVAKDDIKKLRKSVDKFEESSKSLSDESAKLDTKLIDLEARSMRDNLMFYGIPEGGPNENCEELVKGVCADVLRMENPRNMLFDRAHRVGQRSARTRPIVVKFHYYSEREKVRQVSFDRADQLKAANLGIGAQLPKEIRDARKPLYPVMKKAKQDGKNVKFVGKKLFIGGEEYVSETPMEG